jgi:hypothetical protein
MNAEFFLKEKGIFNLDTKKRYNEVIQWMDEYAEAKAKKAFEAGRKSKDLGGVNIVAFLKYPDYETYKQSK